MFSFSYFFYTFCSFVALDLSCTGFTANSWGMSNSTLVCRFSDIPLLSTQSPQISSPVLTLWHGVGCRTVKKTLKFDRRVPYFFHPGIVTLQLGSNGVVTLPPLHVCSALDDFVHFLQESCGLKLVCVCQTIRRVSAEAFNSKVGFVNTIPKGSVRPYMPCFGVIGGFGFLYIRRRAFELCPSLWVAVLRSLLFLPIFPSLEVVC